MKKKSNSEYVTAFMPLAIFLIAFIAVVVIPLVCWWLFHGGQTYYFIMAIFAIPALTVNVVFAAANLIRDRYSKPLRRIDIIGLTGTLLLLLGLLISVGREFYRSYENERERTRDYLDQIEERSAK